jgi:transcription antitermination factor NusG
MYSPTMSKMYFNRRTRSYRWHSAPLFPGYLFMNLRHPRDVRLPFSQLVYGFMRNGDRSYAVVCEKSMELVRILERDVREFGSEFAGVGHPFRPGDMVQIVSGPYGQFEAEVLELKRNGTLKVGVKNMEGALASPVLPSSCLRALAA